MVNSLQNHLIMDILYQIHPYILKSVILVDKLYSKLVFANPLMHRTINHKRIMDEPFLVIKMYENIELINDLCAKAYYHNYLRLRVLKWALSIGHTISFDICDHAIRWNRLRILRWAVANNCFFDKVWGIDWARCNGHQRIVDWIKLNFDFPGIAAI